MGREFELKFNITEDQQALIRRDLGADWQRIDMETTYYDTTTGSLGRRKWTLRRRMENGRSVCTVKTPCPDGGRGEWETECDDIRTAISELCKLGGPKELLDYPAQVIVPVCGARFTRFATVIGLEACSVELALDQGVLLGGGRELPLCEMEVELKSGSQDAAVAFAEGLAEKYGLVPEERSKYYRASMLAKGDK